jgi:hypothetical protein
MADKMREEFEEWRDGPEAQCSLAAKDDAWIIWQASRESLVIELPGAGPTPEPPEDAFDDSYLDGHHAAIRMRNRCYLAIEAAGLKVK